MATRSRIGLMELYGIITSIYCHWSGDPDHHGPILLTHYNTVERVRALMALGDLSCLGHVLGEQHDFGRAVAGHCTAYARDRGDADVHCITHASLATYAFVASVCNAEFLYLFSQDGWAVSPVPRIGATLTWSALDGFQEDAPLFTNPSTKG